MQRTDLDYDGSGRPEYNAATEDYINEHAERLGITREEAAELYEAWRRDPHGCETLDGMEPDNDDDRCPTDESRSYGPIHYPET